MNKVETIRNWISCPQFGDDHYGELGALPYHKRKILKDLCDYVEPLEQHDLKIQQENIELKRQLLEKKCSDKDVEYKEKIKLQKRINKAIEYIEENYSEYSEGSWSYKTINADNVLEILGGENNR